MINTNSDKIKCSRKNKINNQRLDPLNAPITYDCVKTMTHFSLPRRYTSTHNDEKKEIYISVGREYNSKMLLSEEVIEFESQVIGKWVKYNGDTKNKGDKKNKDEEKNVKINKKYQIRLTVLVSTEKNPLAFIRNKVFCQEMNLVLESIAMAESAIMKLNPKLKNVPIYIHFNSIDKQYDRKEYWGTLGYWLNKKCENIKY